jgi:hypothetical protein
MDSCRVLLCLAAALTFGVGAPVHAAGVRDGVVPERDLPRLMPLLGDYRGQWNSELTETAVDDISRYELDNPVMRLFLDADNRLGVQFFLDADAAKNGQPLDLLGFGCRSRVGPLIELKTASAKDGAAPIVVEASFDFDWGRCPSRLHAVPTNDLRMQVALDPVDGEVEVRLTLVRKVQGDYRAYATRDGYRREVKVRPKPEGGGSVYHPALEYCVENEKGEIEACFDQESDVRGFVVPFPFPGASAVWYTRKTPSIKVEKGKKLIYHEALFTRPNNE